MQKKIVLPNGRLKIQTMNDEPSMTQQSFADSTDINLIMKKYHKGEAITHLRRNPGRYVDLTTIKDYQTSLQTVMDAQDAFNALPSAIRSKFQNNPQHLLTFLADENNRDEAIDLGLIPKPIPTSEPPPPPPPPKT